MTDANREPTGRPEGGRFATRERTEGDVVIAPAWEAGTVHPTGGYDRVTANAVGSTFYLQGGLLHREDGPAAVLADGTEQWYYEGVLHRDSEDDQPTTTASTGEREWYRYGALHREGGEPARLAPDGSAEYWENGQRHRGGGKPAIVGTDGNSEWWVRGERHRPAAYGPALIRPDGYDEYWENGTKVARRRDE